MQAVPGYMCAIVISAMIASVRGADAQDNNLSLPEVTVTAPAAPVEPPYMRNAGKAFARNPYLGRYRVEEDKFSEVPCAATRIALGPGGKCLQGYRLTAPDVLIDRQGSSSCDMALDVVIDTVGQLSIEADILVVDPYKVTANGSPSKTCYVQSYMGYEQEDFQDMNRVTRRGTNWHNLQVNGQERSIGFSGGSHNCIAILKPGPVWRGGYVYVTHVSMCRMDTATVRTEDIAYVLASCRLGFTTPPAI
jgi:hypothetical protein